MIGRAIAVRGQSVGKTKEGGMVRKAIAGLSAVLLVSAVTAADPEPSIWQKDFGVPGLLCYCGVTKI